MLKIHAVISYLSFTFFQTDIYISHFLFDNPRGSQRRCSVKKGALKNFAKFTGKQLRQSLFLNKIAGLRPATLLKKRLWHRCFLVNFAKFQRNLFYRTPPDDCFCNSIPFHPDIQDKHFLTDHFGSWLLLQFILSKFTLIKKQ